MSVQIKKLKFFSYLLILLKQTFVSKGIDSDCLTRKFLLLINGITKLEVTLVAEESIGSNVFKLIKLSFLFHICILDELVTFYKGITYKNFPAIQMWVFHVNRSKIQTGLKFHIGHFSYQVSCKGCITVYNFWAFTF